MLEASPQNKRKLMFETELDASVHRGMVIYNSPKVEAIQTPLTGERRDNVVHVIMGHFSMSMNKSHKYFGE